MDGWEGPPICPGEYLVLRALLGMDGWMDGKALPSALGNHPSHLAWGMLGEI